TMAVPLKSLAAEHLDLEDLLKSVDEERLDDSDDQPDLEGWSKLSEIVAPAQRKGFKAFSDAVEAATAECFARNRQLKDALKSHVTQLEHYAHQRSEQDGRAPLSARRKQQVESIRRHLAGTIEELKSIDDWYVRVGLLSERTTAEREAANEQA